jgi:ABC-type multidrug transport system fused ATPase/permease subunit
MPNSIENLREKLEKTKKVLENAKNRGASEKIQKRMKNEISNLEKQIQEEEKKLSETSAGNGEPDNSEPIQSYQANFTSNDIQSNQGSQEKGGEDNGATIAENNSTNQQPLVIAETNENEGGEGKSTQPETDKAVVVETEVIEEGGSSGEEVQVKVTESEQGKEETTDNTTNEPPVIVEKETQEDKTNSENDKSENDEEDPNKLLSPTPNPQKNKWVSWRGEEQTILIVGPSGSGKSTLGNVLTEKKTFKKRTPESSSRETKEVSTEKFSIINEEENSTKPYQVIDTPDFLEESDDTQKKVTIEKTFEILCQASTKLNRIFLVVSNEDIDNENKVRKVLKYSQ